jgi:hypothetical protein
MRSITVPVLGLLMATFVVARPADAQLKLPFRKSSPNNTVRGLELTEKEGPWLIMCTSFVGEDGLQQARRLADELRREHRLKAYIYRHKFDFTEEVAGRALGWEVVEMPDQRKSIRPVQMKPANKAEFEEIAVLVGNFNSVEDSRAQKTLEAIKTLQPSTMASFDVEEAIKSDELAGEKLRAWRGFANLMKSKSDSKAYGPLRSAFLLPNPMLPDEYFEARKVDHFVFDLNKNIKHSLLDNPGIYSVKVATFTGDSTLNLNEIQQTRQEDDWRMRNRKAITSSKLVDAAKKATLLTRELRKKGIEAYEFHDRHESYVCVGSFDWLSQKDASGSKRSNPEIVETILKFKGEPVDVPGKPGAVKTYKISDKLTRAGIACDFQPLPVLVPKPPAPQSAASRFLGKLR